MRSLSLACRRSIKTRSTGLLVAQAMVEGILLLTMDATLLGYSAPVRLV